MLDNGSVSVLVVAVVRQGGVADAEGVEAPQVRDRVADLVQALDAQGRDDLALGEGLHGGAAVDDGREDVRVGLAQPVDEIYLLQSELHT